jgi:hypothetical protein
MCRADNDVMMRAGFNGKGNAVWEYVLVYSQIKVHTSIKVECKLVLILECE